MKTFERRLHFGKWQLYININLKRDRRKDFSLYPKVHFSLTDQSKLPF